MAVPKAAYIGRQLLVRVCMGGSVCVWVEQPELRLIYENTDLKGPSDWMRIDIESESLALIVPLGTLVLRTSASE